MDTSSTDPGRLAIAIAGPTSSGKTTLAHLLLRVFSNDDAVLGSGFTSTVVHQDDFFYPNTLDDVERVKWLEYNLEEWFTNGEFKRTNMKIGATRAAVDALDAAAGQKIIEEYRSQTGHLAAANLDRAVLRIIAREGKNRDTGSVLDWNGFYNTLLNAKYPALKSNLTSQGSTEPTSQSTTSDLAPAAPIAEPAAAATPTSLTGPDSRAPRQTTSSIESTIAYLRDRVQTWISASSIKNRALSYPGLSILNGHLRGLLIIEGFMILPSPTITNLSPLASYDTTLFLSATRAGTRDRRFSRPEYHPPLREPRMTWREESYFDGVAWPAFVREHGWIFDSSPDQAEIGLVPGTESVLSALAKERGVVPRPEAEMGVEETLAWAVGVIIERIETVEERGRRDWIEGFVEGVVRCVLPSQEPFDVGEKVEEALAVELARVDHVEDADGRVRDGEKAGL